MDRFTTAKFEDYICMYKLNTMNIMYKLYNLYIMFIGYNAYRYFYSIIALT